MIGIPLQMAPAIANVNYLWLILEPRRSRRRELIGNDHHR